MNCMVFISCHNRRVLVFFFGEILTQQKRQLTENFKLHKLDVGAHTFPEGSAFGAVYLVQCSQWIRDPV